MSYDSPKGKINGYLVRGTASGKRPAVIVIHENRGLNPHIEDVARRLAAEGFLALAPDLLSVAGGTPADEDARRASCTPKTNKRRHDRGGAGGGPVHPERTRNRPARSARSASASAAAWSTGWPAGSPDLAAAVPYYGIQPAADLVPAIKAPLLLQYAETDANINKGIAAYEAALKANNKKYTLHTYPGTQHAFNNDTGAARYNKAAAELAWSRTLAFFKENLGAPPKAA